MRNNAGEDFERDGEIQTVLDKQEDPAGQPAEHEAAAAH